MTILETKQERDLLGIDSIERAIAYAAMLLYKSIKDPNNPDDTFNRSVTIALANVNKPTAELQINANLPVDRYVAMDFGGNFIESLKKVSDIDPNPIDLSCDASSPDFMAIVQEPFTVNTLERFLYWACATAKANLIVTQVSSSNAININPQLENSEYPRVAITAKLPVDYRQYLRKHNILCTLKPLLTNPIQPFELADGAGTMGNDGTLGNDSTLGNGGELGNNTSVGNNSTFGNNSTLGN